MRTFVIGDIHGNDLLLRKALKAVSLRKSDTLIILGDLIDRGPNSKAVLDTIFLLRENGFDKIVCLRGNHEQMLIDCYIDENKEYTWIKNGGDHTLKSFRVDFANQIPKKYIDLLNSFPYYHNIGQRLFVHAGLNFSAENPFEDLFSMLWIRDMTELQLISSSLHHLEIIHGHTPKARSIIESEFFNSRVKCLDNGVFLPGEDFGKLVIADFESKKLQFIGYT